MRSESLQIIAIHAVKTAYDLYLCITTDFMYVGLIIAVAVAIYDLSMIYSWA